MKFFKAVKNKYAPLCKEKKISNDNIFQFLPINAEIDPYLRVSFPINKDNKNKQKSSNDVFICTICNYETSGGISNHYSHVLAKHREKINQTILKEGRKNKQNSLHNQAREYAVKLPFFTPKGKR